VYSLVATPVEQNVVICSIGTRVGRHAADGPLDVRNVGQCPQAVFVRVQIAQQNDVVFAQSIVLNSAEHIGQRVQFTGNLVRIGMDVDQGETESFTWRWPANPEIGDEGFAMKSIFRVIDRIDPVAIEMDRPRVIDESVLFLARRSPQSRAR
jgi:hypothetical protein